jgi:hypothetical protein
MAKVSILLAALLWSALSWAQDVPTADQWIGLFKEVQQHTLFKDLKVAYTKAPVVNVGDSPVGVMPRNGVDCVVVMSEGDTTKLAQMMALTSSPEDARAFLMTIAAHEFGHCFRIRSGNLSVALWQRGLATAIGSPERQGFEKIISIEEAYADAYAFAYIRDAQPRMYAAMFMAMHRLRREPAFATAYYQVEPLYAHLGSRGLDDSLSLPMQVEAVMRGSKFQLP